MALVQDDGNNIVIATVPDRLEKSKVDCGISLHQVIDDVVLLMPLTELIYLKFSSMKGGIMDI
jgi:hypothetical protein